MTADGNSIMDPGTGSVMVAQIAALAPISGQLTISNFAIAGQTVRDMIANASDVDASYKQGKTNILLVWEIINNLLNANRTGVQTVSDIIEYIEARQAYVRSMSPAQRPWIVLLPTGIPFQSSTNAKELEMQYVNDYIRQNYKAMGAKAFVEFRRPGGPFYIQDVTNGNNFVGGNYNSDHIHLTSQGSAVLAGYVAEALKKLPAR
jgi:lysophospholipase L1-like esterase